MNTDKIHTVAHEGRRSTVFCSNLLLIGKVYVLGFDGSLAERLVN